MSRRVLTLVFSAVAAAAAAGCSVDDLRARAEAVRIQAEGIGSQMEEARSDRLLAEGGGGFETVRPPLDFDGSPPAEDRSAANPAPGQRGASQPPVVIYVPAQ